LRIDEKVFSRLILQMAKDGIASGIPWVNPRKPRGKDLIDLFKQAD